jgi:hypothetical protein
VSYLERLTVPWWGWPLAAGVGVFVALELAVGAPALRHPVTYAVAGLLGLTAAVALSRIRIEVDDAARELRVDDARLPLDVVAAVTPIGRDERRDLLGRDADPLAFVIQRPWVPGGVRVDLNDPADPTPYWYVSSRRPDELAAALRAASASAPSPSPSPAPPRSP